METFHFQYQFCTDYLIVDVLSVLNQYNLQELYTDPFRELIVLDVILVADGGDVATILDACLASEGRDASSLVEDRCDCIMWLLRIEIMGDVVRSTLSHFATIILVSCCACSHSSVLSQKIRRERTQSRCGEDHGTCQRSEVQVSHRFLVELLYEGLREE